MIVGLDVGFGHLKWTTDGHTVHRMPAVAAPTWSEPDVVSGEHAWVVGEHAEREDATLAVALDHERLARPEFQALLGYVFATLPDEPLQIVSGLPYSATEEEQANYERQLRGFIGPYRVGERVWQGPVTSVVLFRQAQAALIDALFDERNRPRRPELLQEGLRIALIDVGYKTTDVVVAVLFPAYQIVREMSLSLDVGVHNVEAILQRAYQRRYGAEMLDRERMRLALDGKRIYRFGQPVSLPVEEAKRQVAERIRAGVVQHWGRAISTVARVFLAGGGAALLGAHLAQPPLVAEMVTDPQGANARGFYKLGRFAETA